jgi:hypothetical protein
VKGEAGRLRFELHEFRLDPMSVWALILQIAWYCAKYLFLIVLSSIVGANLGMAVGLAISALTGEPDWTAHGRCAGWMLFVLVAVGGAPFGFVRLYTGTDYTKKRRRRRQATRVNNGGSETDESKKIVGGLRALLFGPLIGAFMGLILGGMAGGLLVALYFFAALSPLGPGGWWPILPLAFRSSAGGFSSKEPFMIIAWIIVVATFVLLGALLGLFGFVSCGEERYQVFRANKKA